MKKLVIIGAGGCAKSVVDSIVTQEWDFCGFIDRNREKHSHLGFPVLAHTLEEMPEREKYHYIIAIGNNRIRKYYYDLLKGYGLRLASIVDSTAMISSRSSIGEGCFVGKMAIINGCATVKDNCIINTKALVEHGAFVHPHVNMSTNATINGDVILQEGSFLGSASVVIGQLSVGEWAVVGAGAIVIHNVEAFSTVAGVPAVKIKQVHP